MPPQQAPAAVSTPATFHPIAPWNVKPLQDEASGAKICTIATQFNNGFFLQMTAAQEGINSISLNFRQGVFTTGTTANVGISAPGVLKKVLPAVAFKPELLAVNFQGQGALFDAIKTAGVMDFSMGADNQFRFYLSGFTVALPRLAQCMKNHASPGAGIDIPVPVAEPLAPVVSEPVAAAAPPPAVPVSSVVEVVEDEVVQDIPAPLPAPVAPPAAVTFEPSVPAASASGVSELAPTAPPNPKSMVAVNPQDATTLRSANIDQETGRAPPPPPRRLSEIEAPPVFTDSEPVITAPSPEAIAKSRAAMDRYQQEMMQVMPPEAQPKSATLGARLKTPALKVSPMPVEEAPAPERKQTNALEIMTPEGASVRGILDPGPRPEPIKRKRLTEMLADDMQQQYEQMGDEGRLRPDIREQLEMENAPQVEEPITDGLEETGQQYELKPLVAPLVKRGSPEEKALADILMGEDVPPAAPPAAAPPPAATANPVPVLPQHAPGMEPPATPPKIQTTTFQGGQPVPPPGVETYQPKISRQTQTIEADLTEVGKPPEPASMFSERKGKSWLDILREKQEQDGGLNAPLDPEAGVPVYIPDSDAAPESAFVPTPEPVEEPAAKAPQPISKPVPLTTREVDVEKIPAIAAGRRAVPLLTPSEPEPFVRVERATPEQAASQPILKHEGRPVLSAKPPSPAGASGGSGSVLEKRLQIMEQQLAVLTKENVELEAELAFALEQGKQEKVAIESDNWNLEQSTTRYAEAKKQNDRMGAQIQKERAQCTAEKKELEAMLFDPQVTQEAQLARLGQLEDALNDAERKFEEQRQIYEGRIKLLEAQVGQ